VWAPEVAVLLPLFQPVVEDAGVVDDIDNRIGPSQPRAATDSALPTINEASLARRGFTADHRGAPGVLRAVTGAPGG
jgi:hypothetical protein